jgi:dihydrofolate reductase
MRITLIAALGRNRVIGKDNRMPWHISDDLKRFKSLTLGHPVVMGRKTFQSIGKPLPGRDNIVITRSDTFAAPGCRVVHSLPEALEAAQGAEEAFVIGGAEIYALALPLADRLQLTEVDAAIDGDAHFPDFDRGDWREVSREPGTTAGPDGLRYVFVTCERRA